MGGLHVFGNLYLIDENLLKNLQDLKNIVIGAANIGNLTILDILERQFNVKDSKDLGGVSLIALLVESHLALHTWPESNYASLDIYSCGNTCDPVKSFKFIVEQLNPKKYDIYTFDRG